MKTMRACLLVGITEQDLGNDVRRFGLKLGGTRGRARHWSEDDVVHLDLYVRLRKITPFRKIAVRSAAEIAKFSAEHDGTNTFATTDGYTWKPVAETATVAQLKAAFARKEKQGSKEVVILPGEVHLIDLADLRRRYREMATDLERAERA
jgi:hypothetical protein